MSRLFAVLPLVATVDHDIFLFKVQLPERTAVLHSSYASVYTTVLACMHTVQDLL